MPLEKTLTNALKAANVGEYWRSREILRSSLKNYNYDRRLLAPLAEVCLTMKDPMEAGRWFLTFVDAPNRQQQAALSLFVGRFRSAGYRCLLAELPKPLRPRTLADAPKFLQTVLTDLDAPEDLEIDQDEQDEQTPIGSPRRKTVIGCVLITAFIAVCCIVGLVVIAKWFVTLCYDAVVVVEPKAGSAFVTLLCNCEKESGKRCG